MFFFLFFLFSSTNGEEDKIESISTDSISTSSDKIQKSNVDSCQTNDKECSTANEYTSNDSLLLNPNYLPEWYEMITNVPGDWWQFTKDQVNSPDYSMYLFLVGATAGLIFTDDYTYKISDKFFKKSQFNRNMSDLFAEIGDGRTQFGLAACFAAYGFAADDNRALRTASQIVEGVLAAGAVVQLIKHITGRETPIMATSPTGKWRFFPNQIEYHKHVPMYDAFPSGHIATSVAAFVIIAENYPEYSGWITPISIGLSALICAGMVNNGIHWYSDYPLGIAIGYAFGKLIANPRGIKFTDSKEDANKLSIFPYYNKQSIGLSFNFNLK
jgi:membrane-associated phospholipid phosphatase